MNDEKGTKIHFIDGDTEEVQETIAQIHRAIGDLRTGRVPLISLRGPGGGEVVINADHIKKLHETDGGG